MTILFTTNASLSQTPTPPTPDGVPDAVEYRNEVYVSLKALAGLLNGKAMFTGPKQPLGLQPLTLTTPDGSWQFPNGGDRIRSGDQQEVQLKHPVLVHDGRHYVPAHELASVVGYQVSNNIGLTLAFQDKSLALTPIRIDSQYHIHKVTNLSPIHRVVKTTTPLAARRSLHQVDADTIPKGTVILVRRTAIVDGTSIVIVTDCGPEFVSYLIDAEAIDAGTKAAEDAGTGWARARHWFDKAAVAEQGLRHGDRDRLARSACLTVDLCWSLRPFEPELLELFQAAYKGKRPIAPVLFLSGRWTQQHPGEMHHLIELSRKADLDVTWGLHSFDHPKSGNFMNDYTRDQLRADNLFHEAQLLEWGIVPSIYYRFPGLIHDRERLDSILDLDLFPIDCDSWSAIAESAKNKPEKGPFGNPATAGSIILVHGNGNEPAGIPPFRRWVAEHPDWALVPISQFLPGME